MFEKLTPEVLEKFVGGELDVYSRANCHYRGEIADIVSGLSDGGAVSAIKVGFLWLVPKERGRIIPRDEVPEGEKYWMTFHIEQVKFSNGEIKLRTSYGELLTLIVPGSPNLDRDKLLELL